MELLIPTLNKIIRNQYTYFVPTLNKIIRNQYTYFVVVINHRLKIISVHGAPLKSMGGFLSKKELLMRE